MALFIRFIDSTTNLPIIDTYAEKANIQLGVSKTGAWSANFPANLAELTSVEEGHTVEIYYNGELLLTGTIQDITRKYVGTQSLSLSGRDDLDSLYEKPRSFNFFLKDDNIIESLHLLVRDWGWRLGDISTIANKDATTSLDLRNEEGLIQQINKILAEGEDLYYRRGDNVNGYPRLDIGSFGEDSGVSLYSPALFSLLGAEEESVGFLTDFQISTTRTDIARSLEAVGGNLNLASKRPLDFRDVIESDYTRRADAQFPIVEDKLKTHWRMYNTAFGKPGGILEGHPIGGVAEVNFTLGDNTTPSEREWRYFTTFVPMGGQIEWIEFQIATNGASNAWWIELIQLDDYLFHTGNITNGNWTTLHVSEDIRYLGTGRVRYTFPEPIELDWNTRYGIYWNYPAYGDVKWNRIKGWDTNYADEIDGQYKSYENTNNGNFTHQKDTIQLTVGLGPVGLQPAEDHSRAFSDYTPQKTGATVSNNDRYQVADAFYARCLAYLLTRESPKEKFSLSAVGRDIVVTPGDSVFVSARAEAGIDNPATFDAELQRTSYEGYLRVLDVALDFSGDKMSVKMVVQDGDGVTYEDEVVALYNESKTKKDLDGNLVVYTYPVHTFETLSAVHTGVVADGALADGTPAKLFSFTITPPAETFKVEEVGLPYFVTSDVGELRWEFVSPIAELNPTELIIAVAVGVGWTLDNNVTAYQKLMWRT